MRVEAYWLINRYSLMIAAVKPAVVRARSRITADPIFPSLDDSWTSLTGPTLSAKSASFKKSARLNERRRPIESSAWQILGFNNRVRAEAMDLGRHSSMERY
jgi:hypothetical protein